LLRTPQKKANNPTYHNSAHSYEAGNECSNHQVWCTPTWIKNS
jgi:hypothetical protein